MFRIIARVSAYGVNYADASWRQTRVFDKFGRVVVEGWMDETELDNFNNFKDCLVHFPLFSDETVKTQKVEACHIIEVVLREEASQPEKPEAPAEAETDVKSLAEAVRELTAVIKGISVRASGGGKGRKKVDLREKGEKPAPPPDDPSEQGHIDLLG